MPNIQLETGKTLYVPLFEWLFKVEDKDVKEFLQSCVADDLGSFVEDPFCQRVMHGKLEVEESFDIEEAPVDEKYE